MEGVVKIYESSTPDSFDISSPICEQAISAGYKNVLTMSSNRRSYFQLVFNGKYSVVTADRLIPMRKIFNFRDLGGYQNIDKKQIQWGKLYRSGSLAMAGPRDLEAERRDLETLNQLKIKTVIDLRTEMDSYFNPSKFQAEQVFNFPLRGNNYNIFFDKILNEKMKRGDVIVYQQDFFSFLGENNSDYFIKIFDVLLDEKNYPILFFCPLGQDRSAITAALILAALDVDRETIINDYLLSNKLINYQSIWGDSDTFTPEVQETMTALIRAHKEVIVYSFFDRIEKDYGSLSNYLENELKLTSKKRDKLKSLLLYE
jgi:protein-tyrosine phosphatase